MTSLKEGVTSLKVGEAQSKSRVWDFFGVSTAKQ
jgi:hypothetical protein